MTTIERKKDLWWILAITIAPLLIFINKPFHIDDSAFLEVAQNILDHPLDPFHGNVALVDHDYQVFQRLGKTPNTFESMSHPPLVPYMMAAVIKLSGGNSEIPFHLVFMIFPIMAAISGFKLAGRFSNAPNVAVFLLISSPLFMINAQNLMTDVPMLALSLCSLSLFISAVDHQKISFAILAGITAGLAALARYTGLMLPILFIAYFVICRREFRIVLITIALFLTVFGLWTAQNIFIYGTPHIFASYLFFKQFYETNGTALQDTAIKAVSDFAALGGCSFLLGIFLLIYKKKKLKRTFGISIGVSFALLFVLKAQTEILKEYTLLQIAVLFLFVLAGLFFAAKAIETVVLTCNDEKLPLSRREDMVFLSAWLGISLISALFLLPFGTGRYMLPVLFPLILILISLQERVIKPNQRKFLKFSLIGTFIFGLLFSWVDCEYALTHKIFAESIRETYPDDKLWFIGEWGSRHYMKQQGATYLLSNDIGPSAGDIIVKVEIAGLHNRSRSVSERCMVFEPFEVVPLHPIRLMNYDARAGFYSHGFGLLPFALSRVPLERFDICRIQQIEQ